MIDILNIGGEPIFDDQVRVLYNPYVNITFGHSDEIRIYNSRIYTCYRVKVFSASKVDVKGKKSTKTANN